MNTFGGVVKTNMDSGLLEYLSQLEFKFKSWYKNSFTYTVSVGKDIYSLHIHPEYRDTLYASETFESLEWSEPSYFYIYKNKEELFKWSE